MDRRHFLQSLLLGTCALAVGPKTVSLALKRRYWVSITECGAIGDGIANDAPALRAALQHARIVRIPAGIFRLEGDVITLREDQVIETHPKAWFRGRSYWRGVSRLY
jgi:hypothetical protein